MTWKNEIRKDSAHDDIEQQVIETLKQLHEVAINKHIERIEEMREQGVSVTSPKKVGSKMVGFVDFPKYVKVLEEALDKLGYNIPKEKKAGTHGYSDVSDFKQINR